MPFVGHPNTVKVVLSAITTTLDYSNARSGHQIFPTRPCLALPESRITHSNGSIFSDDAALAEWANIRHGAKGVSSDYQNDHGTIFCMQSRTLQRRSAMSCGSGYDVHVFALRRNYHAGRRMKDCLLRGFYCSMQMWSCAANSYHSRYVSDGDIQRSLSITASGRAQVRTTSLLRRERSLPSRRIHCVSMPTVVLQRRTSAASRAIPQARQNCWHQPVVMSCQEAPRAKN